jgi:acetyl esterase/lipase
VPGGTALPVIVYVHGGGWVIGDLDVYDASPRALANRVGALVVSVEYRHAPEFPLPAAHDDVLAATRWVAANAAELGGDPTRLSMVGESAGGNMVAATALALAGEVPLRAQVLVYPVTATSMDTPSYEEARDARPLYSAMMRWFFINAISDASDLLDPRLDLMSVPAEQLAGLPTTLVITAERDPLRDEGEAFAARISDAGVAVEAVGYPGMGHEFFGMAAVVDQAAAAQQKAADHLSAALA